MKVKVKAAEHVHNGRLLTEGEELDIEEGPELSWLVARRIVVPVAPSEPAPLPPVANDPGPEPEPAAQPEPAEKGKTKKEAFKDGP